MSKGMRILPQVSPDLGQTYLDDAKVDVTIRSKPASSVACKPLEHIVLDIGTGLIEAITAKGNLDTLHKTEIKSPRLLSSHRQSLVNALSRIQFRKDQRMPHIGSILSLPSIGDVSGLTDKAYNRCFLLHAIIPKDVFQNAVSTLYDTGSADKSVDAQQFIPLLYTVLSLAFMADGEKHAELGCCEAGAIAENYAQAANHLLHLHEPPTITKLRILLCTVIYQWTTFGAGAALDHLNLACAETLKLGLCVAHSGEEYVLDVERSAGQNLLWTTLFLDMSICGLLAIPSFIEASSIPLGTLAAVRIAARNVSRLARSSETLLLNVALAMFIELFRMMRRAAQTLPVPTGTPGVVVSGAQVLKDLDEIRSDLVDWEVLFNAIYGPRDETAHVLARAQFELRMCCCLAQISLYKRYFKHYMELPIMDDQSLVPKMQYGKLCAKASRQAILACHFYAQQTGVSPLSFLSTYALFISTLTQFSALQTCEESNSANHQEITMLGVFLMRRLACPGHFGTKLYQDTNKELSFQCTPSSDSSRAKAPQLSASLLMDDHLSFLSRTSARSDGFR